jgi:nucleotide-binding universal stress UspA family protein
MARVFNARVTVLHVVERSRAMMPALADPIEWQINRAEADAYMQECVNCLHADGIDASWQIIEGTPADRIHDIIRERQIDLVVLGAHGTTNASLWNLGSVAQKIVNIAPTSLLLVRPPTAAPAESNRVKFSRIMLPLDASQRAECVLPAAITLSQKHHSQVLLVHVVERPHMPRRTPLTAREKKLSDTIMQLNSAEAERYLAGLKDRFTLPADTRVILDAPVAPALHQVSQDERVDLVVLSAHGHTSNMAWPYGSLVASFIAHGNTSVMIVQDMQQKG